MNAGMARPKRPFYGENLWTHVHCHVSPKLTSRVTTQLYMKLSFPNMEIAIYLLLDINKWWNFSSTMSHACSSSIHMNIQMLRFPLGQRLLKSFIIYNIYDHELNSDLFCSILKISIITVIHLFTNPGEESDRDLMIRWPNWQ